MLELIKLLYLAWQVLYNIELEPVCIKLVGALFILLEVQQVYENAFTLLKNGRGFREE